MVHILNHIYTCQRFMISPGTIIEKTFNVILFHAYHSMKLV